MRLLPSLLILVCVAAMMVSPASAQGNGNANGRPKGRSGQTPTSTATTTTPTPSAPAAPTASSTPATSTAALSVPTGDLVAPAVTFRQFGSWLDDASAPTPGDGYSSIGVGHWRMPGVSQTNLPMIGMGVGLSDRLQVSASVPFYRVAYDGVTARGIDDIYLNAKYTVVDPTLSLSEVGLAVGVVTEVLSAGAPGGRVHFAVPVSLEVRRAPFRMYGSAGYFTRGSVFTGGALEWTSPSGLVLSGSLTQSLSVREDVMLDSLAVGRRRMDASAGLAYPLGGMAAVYGSVGRSLTSLSEGGASLALSGGMSFRFRATTPRP